MTQISPSQNLVKAHQGAHTHVALHTTLVVDGETPIALFQRLAGDTPGSFLFESVEGGELMGRYSVLGFGLSEGVAMRAGDVQLRGTVSGHTDPLDAARDLLAGYRIWRDPSLPRFIGGLVGYIGFDCVARFERVPLPPGEPPVPEMVLLLAETVLVYDHLAHRLYLMTLCPLDGDRIADFCDAEQRLKALVKQVCTPAAPLTPWPEISGDSAARPVTSNRSPADYMAAVEIAQQAIAAGEIFQVVISQRFTVEAHVDPIELYRSLRALNPSPYMFYLRFADVAVVGASPEVLVRLEDGELLVRPIAGTRPRGAHAEEDADLAADLLSDQKELAEHRMLLDLGRNDVGRVAQVGSVKVDDPLHIERYAHVMHIVSDVHGQVDPTYDAFDVFRACFPAGTVSGAPKIRACELLAELEPDRRGLYAGAVGYFDFAGNMDTCIAIRTLVVTKDAVHIQAGAGIVYDSVPKTEHLECQNKAKSGLAAVAMTLARKGDR